MPSGSSTVPVGNSPHAVAVSPDGAQLAVDYGASTVTIIATATNTFVKRFRQASGPRA